MQNLTESLAAIRREFSTALTEGTALWFCDFGPGDAGGWFDDPAMMKEIGRLYALAQELIRQPRRRTAEVALVLDPASAYGLTRQRRNVDRLSLDQWLDDRIVSTPAHRSTHLPLPIAAKSPSQAERGAGMAELTRYKLLIFLNTLLVDDQQAGQSARLQKASGPAMLWVWLPGLLGPGGISVEQASRLTGFDLELLRTRLPGRVEITAGPLAAALRTGRRWAFCLQHVQELVGPVLAARDGQRDGLRPGHAALPLGVERPAGRQMFLGVPFAPRQLLADILAASGVHRYDTNFEDVVRGDSRLLVVHTKTRRSSRYPSAPPGQSFATPLPASRSAKATTYPSSCLLPQP